MEKIESFDDPRIAAYQNLKDARLLAHREEFIVEGRGNLLVLLKQSKFQPTSILLSERTFASLSAELGELSVPCPVFVAEQAVMDQIVGFPIHRGCLAACVRPAEADPLALAREALAKEPAPRLVILEGLTNLDNVGGIFRNAMVLGGRGVLLCPQCCDPLYRKAIRVSMGGSLVVPHGRTDDLLKLLEGLKELGFEIWALDPADPGLDLAEVQGGSVGPVAVLVGTEGKGLSEAALSRANRRVRIAMEPEMDSLNVSVATAIALHALRRGEQGGPSEDEIGPIGNAE